MQLKLSSIHLKNFRIHEDYVFEPQDEGITAICGQNGHGKSTIIDSISWALYGTKPNKSLKNKDLRREDAADDDETYVDLNMTLDGQKLRVKRSIVNANGAVSCECWLDGVLEAGPAVSHAERWIVKTLGLDEDSFLSTVLVQQKQVGALVDASPRGRRQILEKLTGIAAVTKALESAHSEELGYSRAAQAFSIDENDVPKIEKNIKKFEEDLERANGQYDKLKARRDRLKKEGVTAKGKLDKLEEKAEVVRRLETESKALKTKVDMLTERQQSLIEKRAELKKDLPKNLGTEEYSTEISDRLAVLEDDLMKAQAVVDGLNDRIKARPSDATLSGLNDDKSSILEKLDAIDKAELENQLKTANDSIADSNAKIRQAKKSLREIGNGDGSGTCPTCLQPIEDISHVRNELNESIENEKARIDSLTGEIAKISEDLKTHEDLSNSLAEANSKIDEIMSSSRMADEAAEKLVPAMGEVKSIRAEVETLRKTVSRLAADRVKREQYESVLDDFSTTTDDLNEASKQADNISAELKEASRGFSWDRLEKSRKDLDERRTKYSEVDNKTVAKKGEIDLIREKANNARRELETLKKQISDKRALLDHLEIASGNVQVLSAFRENKILNAIPQITDYASDYLRRVTEGKFTDVEIDQKFNINVTTEEGQTRDVSMLSGGERDACALCLRLAISVMLSGGEQSLMILDEPITSQDANRAELMLNTIEAMNDGQVIIVAHNEIIQSIADNIVQL